MYKKSLRLFLGFALLYAVVFAAWRAYQEWAMVVRLETPRRTYFHYGLVPIALESRDPDLRAALKNSPPRVSVTFNGLPVPTIARPGPIELSYNTSRNDWEALWPCPWNASTGTYRLSLDGYPQLQKRLRSRPFEILRRKPLPLKSGFVALPLESVESLKSMRVRAPDGRLGDWTALLDWAQYVQADAFWMLGGQTPGDLPGEIWKRGNLDMLQAVGEECHRRGLRFGVYIQCYLTQGRRMARYQYARKVENGQSRLTRSISLADPKRPGDIAKLLKHFAQTPGVDEVGIDYIRNALGGYELADEFYREMPFVKPPPDWGKLSGEERMVYFARKVIMRRDKAFIDAWQWWRAHKVAGIIASIKSKLPPGKPLWAFTLSWDKGWHHGQDPVMFNDAGVDVDAVMLYEATNEQFQQLLQDWHRYIRRSDVQVIGGDVIDWPLHQKSPDGPEAFYRRMTAAIDGLYADGRLMGVFYHDLARALHGRLGPWTTKEWMDAARRVTQYLRSPHPLLRRPRRRAPPAVIAVSSAAATPVPGKILLPSVSTSNAPPSPSQGNPAAPAAPAIAASSAPVSSSTAPALAPASTWLSTPSIPSPPPAPSP